MRLEQQLGIRNFGIMCYAPFDDFSSNSGLLPLNGGGNGDLYVREIPSLDDQLHVHPSTGFAKLKNSGQLLSNYEAAMLDLRGENEGGNARGDNW